MNRTNFTKNYTKMIEDFTKFNSVEKVWDLFVFGKCPFRLKSPVYTKQLLRELLRVNASQTLVCHEKIKGPLTRMSRQLFSKLPYTKTHCVQLRIYIFLCVIIGYSTNIYTYVEVAHVTHVSLKKD